MWVSILPVGGVRTEWGGWTALSTGALVSTQHGEGVLSFSLEVDGAADLATLADAGDPFGEL